MRALQMRAGLPVLAVAAGFQLATPPGVEAKPLPKPSDLIETYDTMDRMCGETGSPVSAATACEQRDRLYGSIKALGWCKGRTGQAQADFRWHTCGRASR